MDKTFLLLRNGGSKMIYEIVLVDGSVLECWTKSIDSILEMMFKDDIFIVQENGFSDKVTYLMPSKVSHYRFPSKADGVGTPR